MSTEAQKTILKLTSDPRLRAGVLAVLEHICEKRSVNAEEKREVGASIERECKRLFEEQEEPECVVEVDEMEDRMQISVKSTSGKVTASVVKHFHRDRAHH